VSDLPYFKQAALTGRYALAMTERFKSELADFADDTTADPQARKRAEAQLQAVVDQGTMYSKTVFEKPAYRPFMEMGSLMWLTNMRLRAYLPLDSSIKETDTCKACGSLMDGGYHAMACRNGKGIHFKPHEHVIDVIRRALAGIPGVTFSTFTPALDGTHKRADFEIRNAAKGDKPEERSVYDTTTVNPRAESYRGKRAPAPPGGHPVADARMEAGRAAKFREHEKGVKYFELFKAQGLKFFPMVLEATGGWGPATKHLRSIFSSCTKDLPTQQRISIWKGALAEIQFGHRKAYLGATYERLLQARDLDGETLAAKLREFGG
jgi:hypothetical protein